ncbi:MAG: hypothetical protein M3O62_17720 [Pseudomonadota bacterium]|nr:hypothetical protein [Pseudomonadota bacterium]
MDMASAKQFLLWTLLVNYGFLLSWFFAFLFARSWMFRQHGRWFTLTEERFDAIHYAGMAAYKIGILMFNLAPYLALALVEHTAS